MTNKAIWKLTILPKTFIFTPKANSKQKRVKTTQEHEKVHCYYETRLAGWLTRRGDLAHSLWQASGEQTLLCVTIQLAVASRLRVVASHNRLMSGRTIFHPKNPVFIHPNPKFDRELNLWRFYELNLNYTQILWTFYYINNQFLHHDLIPKFTKQQQQLHVKFNFRIT